MKVMILSPALTTAGGIQRYSNILVRAFTELLGSRRVRCLELPEVSNQSGSRLSLLSKLRYLWQVLLASMRERRDLVVCTHLSLGPIAWMLARVGGYPYWIVAHGIEAWVLLPLWKRAALRRADRVIVTSEFSRKQLLHRQGIQPERLLSLPCTLDETLLDTQLYGGLPEFLRGDRPLLLTVGRMMVSERYKGYDVVLRSLPFVVARVPNLAYVIVGDGDDRERLQRLALDLNLGKHVFFTGTIRDSELAALYRRSEVFVLPARTVVHDDDCKGEGFGIVFLEAMAFGKPVIGPNYGAPTELIVPGENGLLVDPENTGSISRALLELLEDPSKAQRMGKAGRALVREHYSYKSFIHQLAKITRLADQMAQA